LAAAFAGQNLENTETNFLSQSETEFPLKVQKQEIIEPPSMPEWGLSAVRFVGRQLSRLFFRIKYINLENIPQDRTGGLLICANHQSFFDPFWICFPVYRQIRYLTWDAATRWFLIGNFIRALGAFPVNLERGGKDALKMSRGWLKSGGTLVIFPEGERGFSDGKLLNFKNGALRIALQAGVPILPVTIRGGNRVWSQDMPMPRLAKVEIVYHPLFELPPAPDGVDLKTHAENLTVRVKEIIASALPSESV
jgi:1-acyl-sn-glycerol-3-phosphate acyltransferase